ncbi:Flp family type IVb pilin [Aureimonas glaciei]|jgi:pilus assembly protein Flp/PilA|nr:Flp family type IVb pilin [Aureimonas glaciei]
MVPLLRRFRDSRSGATAIEYGVIASLIGTALIAALTLLSPDIIALFDGIGSAFTPVR